MGIYIPSHDERLMPIELGSVLRCPYQSWNDWGVKYDNSDFPKILELSEQAYRAEWGLGSKERHDIVNEASLRSGFADHNNILAENVARYVSETVNDYNGKIKIMDIGAGVGNSALKIFENLSPRDKERVTITLLEPAVNALEIAASEMEKIGARYETVNGSDIGIMNIPEEYDIVTGVASVHHHAKIPWGNYLLSLKNGGRIVLGDWHNGMWLDKEKVYKMLERMGTSHEGLRNFEESYRVEGLKSPLTQADVDIMEFWNAYKSLLDEKGYSGERIILPLEGQRPNQMYIDEMDVAGFKNIEADSLLDGTELIALTTAQKKV